MVKPVDIILEFSLPEGVEVGEAKLSPEGELILRDKEGVDITPSTMNKVISRKRNNKNPKVIVSQASKSKMLSFSGVKELTEYDGIFSIDTNNPKSNKKIWVSAFICSELKQTEIGIELISPDGKVHFYEFHGVKEKPELLAIYKLIQDLEKSTKTPSQNNFLIITDTEENILKEINNKKIPLYKNQYLPDGFTLVYASADTGNWITNKLIRFCDKQSNAYYELLMKHELPEKSLRALEQEPAVQFRYMSREDLEIVNPIIVSQEIPEGTEIRLYGKNKRSNEQY